VRKVFVIGLDCLDYYIVENLNCKEFLQKVHKKLETIINPEVGEPSTEEIWISIITGVPPEVHKVRAGQAKRWKSKTLQKFREVLIKIEKKNRSVERLISKLRPGKFFEKLGFEKTGIVDNLPVKTIFDIVKPSIAYSIPVYNEDLNKYWELIGWRSRDYALKHREIIAKRAREYFLKEVEETLKLIKNDWILFFVHYQYIDDISHMYYDEPEIIEQTYYEVEEIIKNIKNNLPKDTVVLIVSDHGINDIGLHAPYSFFSINVKIDEKYLPKSVLDLKDFIINLIYEKIPIED